MFRVHTDGSQFTDLLCCFDQDLAEQCRARGCPLCGARLHRACYPRKPRGGGPRLSEDYGWRWSFCYAAEACRKRATPPSLRYLGRRVYLGAVVALMGYEGTKINSLKNFQLIDYGTNRGEENGRAFAVWINNPEHVADKPAFVRLHLIPTDEALWSEDKFEQFIEARGNLIVAKLQKYIPE